MTAGERARVLADRLDHAGMLSVPVAEVIPLLTAVLLAHGESVALDVVDAARDRALPHCAPRTIIRMAPGPPIRYTP